MTGLKKAWGGDGDGLGDGAEGGCSLDRTFVRRSISENSVSILLDRVCISRVIESWDVDEDKLRIAFRTSSWMRYSREEVEGWEVGMQEIDEDGAGVGENAEDGVGVGEVVVHNYSYASFNLFPS